MKVTVQLVIESENGSTKKVSSVGEWQRNEPLQPSNLGLALASNSHFEKKRQ